MRGARTAKRLMVQIQNNWICGIQKSIFDYGVVLRVAEICFRSDCGFVGIPPSLSDGNECPGCDNVLTCTGGAREIVANHIHKPGIEVTLTRLYVFQVPQ